MEPRREAGRVGRKDSPHDETLEEAKHEHLSSIRNVADKDNNPPNSLSEEAMFMSFAPKGVVGMVGETKANDKVTKTSTHKRKKIATRQPMDSKKPPASPATTNSTLPDRPTELPPKQHQKKAAPVEDIGLRLAAMQNTQLNSRKPPAKTASKSKLASNVSRLDPKKDNPAPRPPPTEDSGAELVIEDGNVDYCLVCKQGGGLVCCDICPRAYHTGCIGVNEDDLPDGDWKCHKCKTDVKPCAKIQNVAPQQMLKMLKGIVDSLIEFDFGYAFKEAVDGKAYERVIEEPMCYDWINDKIDNDDYGDILPELLRDLHLVFENCYRFNSEGSAIFRMAEVHERRCKSLLNQLTIPGDVTKQVNDWVEKQKKERLEYLVLCKYAKSVKFPSYNISTWKTMSVLDERVTLKDQCKRDLYKGGIKTKAKQLTGVYMADHKTGWMLDTFPTFKMASTACIIKDCDGKTVDLKKILDEGTVCKVNVVPGGNVKVFWGRMNAVKKGNRDVGMITIDKQISNVRKKTVPANTSSSMSVGLLQKGKAEARREEKEREERARRKEISDKAKEEKEMEIRVQYGLYKVVNDNTVLNRQWPILKKHGWSHSRGNGLISWIYVKPGCSKNGIEGVDFLATESQVLDLLPMRGRTREEFELHGDGSGERLPFTACDKRAGRTGRARTAEASAIDEELKRKAALKQEKKRKREEEIDILEGEKKMGTTEVQQKLTGTVETQGFGMSSPPPKNIRLPPGLSVEPSAGKAMNPPDSVANVVTGKGNNDSVKSPTTKSIIPDPQIELSSKQQQKKADPVEEFGKRLAAMQNAELMQQEVLETTTAKSGPKKMRKAMGMPTTPPTSENGSDNIAPVANTTSKDEEPPEAQLKKRERGGPLKTKNPARLTLPGIEQDDVDRVGTISAFNPNNGLFHVTWDDGDTEWLDIVTYDDGDTEWLDKEKEKWEFLAKTEKRVSPPTDFYRPPEKIKKAKSNQKKRKQESKGIKEIPSRPRGGKPSGKDWDYSKGEWVDEVTTTSTSTRKSPCGKCENCQKPDCGKCKNCVNRPVWHQRCKDRTCLERAKKT